MARDRATRPLRYRFNFRGEGSSFFGIHLATMFLSAITLGVYSFWGRVKVRSYLYSQTEFAGERFAYHGTGMELLKGWAKAGAVISVVLGLNSLLTMLSDELFVFVLSKLILLAFGLALAPFAIVGSRRYRLTRTSWQGIRFDFRGSAMDYAKVFVPAALLNVVTLGLYYPFMLAKTQTYLAGHTAYGSERFTFDGEGSELFPQTLMAVLLTPLTLGIYGFWYKAHVERFIWENTSFAGARFRTTITGGELFMLGVTNGLLMLVTLGLAYPWVKVREIHYKLWNLSLVGNIDWSQIRQDAQTSGAFAEGMADHFELELGV
ncbi:Inner membrane protein YjgN [compost metagenome]